MPMAFATPRRYLLLLPLMIAAADCCHMLRHDAAAAAAMLMPRLDGERLKFSPLMLTAAAITMRYFRCFDTPLR